MGEGEGSEVGPPSHVSRAFVAGSRDQKVLGLLRKNSRTDRRDLSRSRFINAKQSQSAPSRWEGGQDPWGSRDHCHWGLCTWGAQHRKSLCHQRLETGLSVVTSFPVSGGGVLGVGW
jgi:hypothetical protein